jgi:dimethylglycine dehydrogenase
MGKAKIFSSLFDCDEHHLISTDEIRRLHPLVQFEDSDIACGLYTTGDGHIDPTSLTNAFADRAKALGGKIRARTEVVGLNRLPGKRWEVITRSGEEEQRVEADFVINAGGLWCDRVGDMAGVHTPSVVLQHQYVITDPIPEVKAYHEQHGHQMPVLRDLRGSFYLRDEGDGILIGPYENQAVMELAPSEWRKSGMPTKLSNFLFSGDVDRLMPHLERAMELVPCTGEVGLKTVLNGPTMWPADGSHLVGPAPEWDKAPNFWQACAESYGIAHSAGLGRYLSSWILDGEPPYELRECDPGRYGPWATKDWVGEKVAEAYGMNNHAHCPNENLFAARPVLPEPHDEMMRVLEEKGCQFGFHNGYEGPNWFDPSMAGGKQHKNKFASFHRPEYSTHVEREVREMAQFGGICYWPFAKFVIKGAGAVEWLDKMVSNKLPSQGRCALSYFLTPSGKVYSEVMLARIAQDEFYMVSYPESELFDWRWMHTHLSEQEAQRVSISNITPERGTLMVAGPESRAVLARMSNDPESWSAKNFKFYQWRDVELAGIPCRALRVSFTGELGWELHPLKENLAPLYHALKGAEPRLCDWGGAAMGSFRLEKGFKAFGSDMTKDHCATECLEPRFLRLEKNFIGRDALALAPPPTRHLVHLAVDSASDNLDPLGNEVIRAKVSGEVVGFTTSGGYGYLAQRSIAFGYVNASSLNQELTVEILGKQYDARVNEGPFRRETEQQQKSPEPISSAFQQTHSTA